jgi:hypothetical protein
MAIITEDTPIGFELPPVERQLSVELNTVKTDNGDIPTLHTDPEAAAREGLDRPIAIGSRIFGVIPRMMMNCFGEGWIVGGKGSIVTRRSAARSPKATIKFEWFARFGWRPTKGRNPSSVRAAAWCPNRINRY